MPKRTPGNSYNHIREFRLAAALNQRELADIAEIGVSTIARYESATFAGRISPQVKERIAAALHKPVEAVFPSRDAGVSRRQFLGGAGAAALGAGLAASGLSGLGSSGVHDFEGTIWGNQNRRALSDQEVQVLGDDNYATWELFDNLQRGATADYVSAVAQGKLVTLKHLAQCTLPEKQRRQMLVLVGDMYLLLGRLAREAQNFGAGEHYFNQAILIAREAEHRDLLAATRQRYGFMLMDQGRFGAAMRNGEAALEESKGASFPIWAEAQLIAAHAFAQVGRIQEAQRIARIAQETKPGGDPEMWIGKVTNPKTVYPFFEIVANLAAQRPLEAAQAAENAIIDLDKEQPDNLQFRVHIQLLQSTALWELGALDDAVLVAKTSLRDTRLIGSTINEARIEKLHQTMRRSSHARYAGVRDLGEMLIAG